MIRGGSFFSRQLQCCRQGISSGSRQCSSSGRAVAAMPVVLYYLLETVAYKSALFYVGSKAAIYKASSQPEKHAPEIMSLCEKKQLLDVELKHLDEKEALLAQL